MYILYHIYLSLVFLMSYGAVYTWYNGLILIPKLVGRSGRVVERRTFGDRGSKPPAAVSKPGQFRSPYFARIFRKIYARGSKRSHTGGKCVSCCGLKEWWSLSLTHQFPARERRRSGPTTPLRSPVLDRKKQKSNKNTCELVVAKLAIFDII